MPEVKCSEIELLLDAYHDGQLELPQNQAVEEHLAQCPPCKAQLASISRLVATLKTLPRLEPEVDFSQQLDSLLAGKNKPVVIRPVIWAALAACAALAVLWMAPGKHISPQTAQLPQAVEMKPAISPPATLVVSAPSAQLPPTKPYKQPDKPVVVVPLSKDSSKLEIASLLEEDRNTITESIGLVTDEDGLYALKL